MCACANKPTRKMSTDVLPAAAGGMSSVAIAQVTGKKHWHVIRDIRALLEQGVSQTNFGLAEYLDQQGKTRPCYQLSRKGCLILASGYNALLREKIIDRLEELELARQKTLPSEAFAALEERVKMLEASVRGLRPSGDVGCREVRIVRYNERAIVVLGDTRCLRERMRKLGGKWCPFLTVDGAPERGWVFTAMREEEITHELETLGVL